MTVHFPLDNIKFPSIPNQEIVKNTIYTSIPVNTCITYLFLNFHSFTVLTLFFTLFIRGSTRCVRNTTYLQRHSIQQPRFQKETSWPLLFTKIKTYVLKYRMAKIAYHHRMHCKFQKPKLAATPVWKWALILSLWDTIPKEHTVKYIRHRLKETSSMITGKRQTVSAPNVQQCGSCLW